MQTIIQIITLWSLLCGCIARAAGAGAGAGTDRTTTARETRARVIGGQDTVPGRFPYAVSVRSHGGHNCGGSLIAPDLVLSAAHCQVTKGAVVINRWDGSNPNEEGTERFAIVEEILHPRYDYLNYYYDTMIIKFDGLSSVPPITLNRDLNLLEQGQPLTVMGWGLTSDEDEYNPVLQEAPMTYVSWDKCREIWGNVITPDMMCAQGSTGFDCTGDSGGPLVVRGSDASTDLQVGAVTWGPENCVDYNTPSVYSFVANQIDWIDSVVCGKSSNPPADFDCSATFSPAPSEAPSAPSVSPAPSIPQVLITLVLSLDEFPQETGFFIEDSIGMQVIYMKPSGDLVGKEGERFTKSFYLDADRPYSLVLFDTGLDGFCCDYGHGNFAVYLGDSKTGTLLISGEASFEDYTKVKFITSDYSDGINEEVVTQQGEGDFPIVIKLASNSSVWTLRRVDVSSRPLVANPSVLKGTNSATILAERGGLYQMIIDGPDPGFHVYPLAVNASVSTVLLASERAGTFTFLTDVEQSSQGIDNGFLTIRILTDDYPEEVGWILFADQEDSPIAVARSDNKGSQQSNDYEIVEPETTQQQILAFGPESAYDKSLAHSVIRERIHLPSIGSGMRRHFTFVIHDSGRDGLCCSFGEGNFKVYLGSVRRSNLLFGDSFERRERLVYSFSLRGLESSSSFSTRARWFGQTASVLILLLWMA